MSDLFDKGSKEWAMVVKVGIVLAILELLLTTGCASPTLSDRWNSEFSQEEQDRIDRITQWYISTSTEAIDGRTLDRDTRKDMFYTAVYKCQNDISEVTRDYGIDWQSAREAETLEDCVLGKDWKSERKLRLMRGASESKCKVADVERVRKLEEEATLALALAESYKKAEEEKDKKITALRAELRASRSVANSLKELLQEDRKNATRPGSKNK
jgi:hypothetical protein